jgi:carbamoyl-phosphate synthase small subunit
MKFGHHGANHPVKDLDSGRVSITSQNHGFAVDEQSLPATLRPTTSACSTAPCRAWRAPTGPPSASRATRRPVPGPHDIAYLFDRFVKLMEER